MTIKNRLAFLFTAVVAVLVLIFCLVIFYEAEFHRENEYKSRLRQETSISLALYFNQDSLSQAIFGSVMQSERTVLNQEEIRIYKQNKELVYESGKLESEIAHDILRLLQNTPEVFMDHNERQVYGTTYNFNDAEYFAITSAYDKYGLSKMRNLAWMLFLGGILTISLSFIAGRLLAGRFLKPINDIILKIDKITGSQLSLRLDEGNQSDEIEQLSMRFNKMLDRLEKAFAMEKAFVSHASHELRTPLTAITGQIQVSLLAKDDPDALKSMITSVLDDVQSLNKLTNNLLDLTSVDSTDKNIDITLINLAEVLWNARSHVLSKNKEYEVLIHFEENEDLLPEVMGNESLLETAFINLLENGAKFSSNNSVTVGLDFREGNICICVENTGKPIDTKDRAEIFQPFRRGANAFRVKGHGVGLALTQKIIKLHDGTLELVQSNEERTVFKVCLPQL